MGCLNAATVYVQPRQWGIGKTNTDKYVVGSGLRSMHRYILGIHPHHDRPAYTTPDSRLSLQLRTAYRLRSGVTVDGYRSAEAYARIGCRTGVQWCLAGNKVEVQARYGSRKK